MGVSAPLLFSDIPRWLKLRSPIPNVFTAGSFSSALSSLSEVSPSVSRNVSTSGLSTSLISSVPLRCRPPGTRDVLAMLVVREFAAFCAAEKTLLKKPVWLDGVIDLFSGVGVREGADVILESLLGPSDVDVDLTRRCDIIFPEGDVMTLGFETTEPGVPRSEADGKRGILGSVGVGGVFTIIGVE